MRIPNIAPQYPFVNTGAPAGTPGNAPISTPAVTASGIPLGCTGCSAAAAPSSGVIGLKDISPPTWPTWLKWLIVGGCLGGFAAIAIHVSRRAG